jgi:Protein of unknown function (DUF3160)
VSGPEDIIRARQLLSGFLDGELDPDEQALVERCVEADDDLAAELEELMEVAELVHTEAVVSPRPEAWRDFEAALRQDLAREVKAPHGARSGAAGWVRLALAVAAVLLGVLWIGRGFLEPPIEIHAQPRLALPSLDHHEPRWRPADPEPVPDLSRVDGLARAEELLSPAALAAITSHGLVQVPAPAARLADLYPVAVGVDRLPPLATADASLLLFGAVSSRAALSLERELIVPGSRDLLEVLVRELHELERMANDRDVRRAARRARETIGVAAALRGVPTRLTGDSQGRVEAELERIAAVGGVAASEVLGRPLDYAGFRPRGIYAGDEALEAHYRAMTWLRLAALPVDPADLESTRAVCLIALALARGQLADGSRALLLQDRLETAIAVLYGEPDGLTPFDVLENVRQGLGTTAPRVSDLGSEVDVERVARRSLEWARTRGLNQIRSAGEGEAAPAFRLLGGTRGLEARVHDRLTDPHVRRRPGPSALDLLVVLGSRRARTAVSALLLDAPGYDAAVDAMAGEAFLWSDPSLPVPARACLEQDRVWAVSALLDGTPRGPAPFMSSSIYRDRLLMAALGALNAPGASAVRPLSPPELGSLPLVEPLPRLHARLSFSARRLAGVCQTLRAQSGAPSCPELDWSIAALERVAELEAALRDASLDVLEGRRLGDASAQLLRGYAATLRDLGPPTAYSAEDLYEDTRGGRVLHRVVYGLDRLVAVGVDPWTGERRLAQGAALAVTDLWTNGERLTPTSVPQLSLRDPIWASHIERR